MPLSLQLSYEINTFRHTCLCALFPEQNFACRRTTESLCSCAIMRTLTLLFTKNLSYRKWFWTESKQIHSNRYM